MSIFLSDKTPALWQLQQGQQRQAFLVRQLQQFNQDISTKARRNKYGKMAVDSFVFFRGTAHLYYQDLHHQQILQQCPFVSEDAVTWLQGDLHVENYGAFCDGQGDVIYDLNDFDESWIDSYLYDLYRLVTSLLLVIERQDEAGEWDRQALCLALSTGYVDRLFELKKNPADKQVKITKDNAFGKLKKFLEKAEAANSRRHMLDKWTVLDGDERYFDLESHKLERADEFTRQIITDEVEGYHHRLHSDLKGNADYFSVVDVARRLGAGTGSLGIPRYYVLIDGHNESEHDYRILDVKLQGLPSHYPYLSEDSLKRMRNLFPKDAQGCRVAAAQRAMHVDADEHLGSIFVYGHSYSVRERSPYKKTLNTAKLTKLKHINALAEQWGSIVATAHARGDREFDARLCGRFFEDVMHDLLVDKQAEFHAQIFGFATTYAKQVNMDFQLFSEALKEGML